jgi:hypothetical protein
MPKYVYFCKECKETFETRHSLQKTCTICEICGIKGEMVRRPTPFFLSKKASNLDTKSTPGQLVNAVIQETQEDLKEEKAKLRSRTYDRK